MSIMSNEDKCGFKVHSVEIFNMSNFKRGVCSVAIYKTESGHYVVRRNDIPISRNDNGEKKSPFLVSTNGISLNEDPNVLYELPFLYDNFDSDETSFTVLKKSEHKRDHIISLFEHL